MRTEIHIILVFFFQIQNGRSTPTAFSDMSELTRPVRSMLSDLAMGTMAKASLLPLLKGASHLLGRDEDDYPILPDVSNAPWHALVAPFFRYVPSTIAEFCQCRGLANCGCCVGFYVSPWQVRNNVCLNVTLGHEAHTNSDYSFHSRFIYDRTELVDFSVSEREPPSVCLSIIPFNQLQGCLRLANLHMDSYESKGCMCGTMLLKWREKKHPIVSLPTQCLCIGKPVPQHKKQGVFGIIPFFDLVDLTKSVIG